MTIGKGTDWGERGPLAPGAPVLAADRDVVASLVGQSGAGPVEFGLTGGDLHRTLGSPRHVEADLMTADAMRFPIDLVDVVVVHPDGSSTETRFCSHLLALGAKGRPFEVPTYVAMNASFLGVANLGPRAHPGDALIDITEGVLPRRDRRAARRRILTGSHLPHPDLRTRRVKEDRVQFDSVRAVSLDGNEPFEAVELTLRCAVDAAVVVV